MFPICLRNGIYVSFVLLVLVGIGCSTQESSNKKDQSGGDISIANKSCPIRGNEVNSDGKTVQWNGKTIGFCCDECIPTWNDLSDKEKTEKLAKAGHANNDGKKMEKHEKHKH